MEHVMKVIQKRASLQILKPPDRIRPSPDIESLVLKQQTKCWGGLTCVNHRKTVPESRRSNVLTAEVLKVLADKAPSARLLRQN
jgi:hypothetical protein